MEGAKIRVEEEQRKEVKCMVNVKEIGKAHYEIDKAIYWNLHGGKSLLSALVDQAGRDIEIPEEARDIWLGEVDYVGPNFEVTLYYDADSSEL